MNGFCFASDVAIESTFMGYLKEKLSAQQSNDYQVEIEPTILGVFTVIDLCANQTTYHRIWMDVNRSLFELHRPIFCHKYLYMFHTQSVVYHLMINQTAQCRVKFDMNIARPN